MIAANTLQRRWCTQLLERAPKTLRIMRTNIASSRAWLELHPSRVLFPAHRERLSRYQRLLDAHGVPMRREFATKTTTKQQQTRQLALGIEGRKADRT